jgi:ADP-ribosyl-[dinitrogen reductase] hydrolase
MIGSIIGDIAGSCYEFSENKDITSPLFPPGADFTDDTVMLVATAHALLRGKGFSKAYRTFGAQYPSPMGGYGARFGAWLESMDPEPYGSWGNGSAMRVPPVGWAFASLEETLQRAGESAAVTHNHPEGIKGASATAAAIWLARTGTPKEAIRNYVMKSFGYDLQRTCDSIRPSYRFNESSQGTVPEAIIAFLDSTDFEHAIQLAISLGGDADTLACITGGIAQAYYKKIPAYMIQKARNILDPSLLSVVEEFNRQFNLEP